MLRSLVHSQSRWPEQQQVVIRVPRRGGGAGKRTRAITLAGMVLTSGALCGQASAQQVDSEFSVQRFNPAPGPRNLLTTRTLRMKGEMAFSAGAMANYAYKPFVVKRCEPPAGVTSCDDADAVEEIPVVENLVSADLLGTL